MKKIVAFVLSVIILTGTLPVASFAQSNTASLYEIYDDGMVFERDKPITVAGTAQDGTVIAFDVTDRNGEVIRSASGTAENGRFSVTCAQGVSGGYASYTLNVYSDGSLFETLSDVLFGIVWIANGQSNMELSLRYSDTGAKMVSEGRTGSQYLRFLDVEPHPIYNAAHENNPLYPQLNIPNAHWDYGNSSGIYDISAVGYYYAVDMLNELDMPIGMLCIPLGGSSIYTWLSRKAIDGDPEVKADLESIYRYIPVEDWDESNSDLYYDMTGCYNKKIEALQFFNIEGMIWYQGEADHYLPHGFYTRAFDLMQRSYSEIFGFEDSPMPIVYSQIADFNYETQVSAAKFNMELGEIQQIRPDSRAVVTIYDVPLTYVMETHYIHPICKEPVGKKLARAALGLVYGKYSTYTSPVFKSSRTDGKYMYLTFSDTGDGLCCVNVTKHNSCPIYGFTVCGEDGIYLKANAQIVSRDTVKVWNDSIASPVNAAYALSEQNCESNLFSTENATALFGVCPFTTSYSDDAHYWQPKIWADCDNESAWQLCDLDLTGFYDCWDVVRGDAEISYNSQDKVSGAASLQIDSSSKSFSLRPVTFVHQGKFSYREFSNIDYDYSDYGTMSFSVKNNTGRTLTLDEVRFYNSRVSWYSPSARSLSRVSANIPADGEWHTVTLNLNDLNHYGKSHGFAASNNILYHVFDMQFVFSGNGGQVLLDGIEFTASTASAFHLPRISISNCLHEVCSFISANISYFYDNLKF